MKDLRTHTSKMRILLIRLLEGMAKKVGQNSGDTPKTYIMIKKIQESGANKFETMVHVYWY